MISAMLFCLLLASETVHAQTVSIITGNDDTESIMVQAAMKRAITQQGYTVKTDTYEGIVVILSVMTAKSNNGTPFGVVGHMSMVTRQWQQFAEIVAFAKCKKDQPTAQYIQNYLGIPMTYLHASMAVGSTEEVVANALSKDAIRVIKETTSKMQTFLTELNKRIEQSQSPDVIKPMR